MTERTASGRLGGELEAGYHLRQDSGFEHFALHLLFNNYEKNKISNYETLESI